MLTLTTVASPAAIGADLGNTPVLEALAQGDQVKACRAALRPAQEGNLAAQLRIGTCFQTGTGFPRDHEQAAHWFRKAMAEGDTTAQAWLGGMMVEGQIAGGKAEGARLIREAAEQGDPFAEQRHAHMLYLDGRPSEQSIRWLKRAVAGGNEDAAFDLAEIYRRNKDDREAATWRDKGAAMTAERAKYPEMLKAYLSGNYEKSSGETPREGYIRSREILMGKAPGTVEEAVRLTERAARSGYAEAEAQMGYLHYHGTGLPRDLTEAVYWLRRASLHGSEEARGHLDQVMAEAAKER